MKPSNYLKSIVVFYVLAFAISWAGWLPLLLLSSQKYFSAAAIYIKAFLIFPAASPVLAALLTRRLIYTEENRKSLVKMVFHFRVELIWYLAAAFAPLAILVLTKFFESFINHPQESSLPAGTLSDVLSILIVSLAANPCEEIGWRGFALPRLQNIYNPFIASLLIGILSGLWHLPFFYWRESPMATYPFLPWLTGTICVAFIATWLFNNTKRSLVIVSLFHISLNTTSVLVGINSFYTYAAASVVFVIFILAFFGRQFFSFSEPSIGDKLKTGN